MTIVVAPVMFQVRFDVPPEEIVLGVAVNELMTGAMVSVVVFVVTVAVAFSVPKLLTAVNVYVVVPVGIMTVEPEEETVPIDGLMEIDFDPVTDHVRVVLSPSVIEAGVKENSFITGGLVEIAVRAAFVALDVSTVTVTDLFVVL